MKLSKSEVKEKLASLDTESMSEDSETLVLAEANEELANKLRAIRELKADPDWFVSILSALSVFCGGSLMFIGIPTGQGLAAFGLTGGLFVVAFDQKFSQVRKWIGDI